MKLTRLTIREYAESLAVAFILAMIIRHFVVEAFRIPTSSMEPTLIGSETHGDRILVSKFQFDLHPPQQWDVVVFKIDQTRIDYYRMGQRAPGSSQFPNGTIRHPGSPNYVNYVKRLVGLPGHSIQVRNGDIFVDGRICRKPDHAQNVLLVPVFSNGILRQKQDVSADLNVRRPEFSDFWTNYGHNAVTFRPDGSVLLAGTKSTSECDVRFLPRIEDRVDTDPKTANRNSFNVVGDLKLAFRFRYLGGAGYLIARLSRNGLNYTFYIPLGKKLERPALACGGSEVARAVHPFEADGEHVAEFSNIDARAVLKIDGRTVLSFDNDAPSEASAESVPWVDQSQQSSAAEFGVSLCDAEVRDVRLWRDIYYTAGDPGRPPEFGVRRPFVLGRGEYFMMGDNSPNSFDSRNWGIVEQPALIGEAFFVFWPVPRWKFIN